MRWDGKMIKRPKTVMVRIREKDLNIMKRLSKKEKMYLPDLQTEIIKCYKKKK